MLLPCDKQIDAITSHHDATSKDVDTTIAGNAICTVKLLDNHTPIVGQTLFLMFI